jgi:hypothetical protein
MYHVTIKLGKIAALQRKKIRKKKEMTKMFNDWHNKQFSAFLGH